MNLNSVLSQLITKDISFPALRLAWSSQIDVQGIGTLPKISPSHYMQENLLTTDQRRELICKQQRKVPCRKADLDLFVEPAVIVFQNYKFGDTLSFLVSIRNISKTSQKVTILMEENNVFKFDENSQRVAKFPTGMSMITTIKFQPEDDRDYYHKLVVKTPKARFAIPIIGIGGRGLLNVAESIIFENVPVKYYKTKSIPVFNLGTKPARFTLSTTGQFCVKPEKGVVSPRETFSLEVSHYSALKGVTDGHLLIKYDNGEEIYVYLKAETVDEDVTLTPQVVQCEDTYLGMKTKVLCCIQNNSDVILHFKWSTNPVRKSGDCASDDEDTFSIMDDNGDHDRLSKAIDLLEQCSDGNEDCLGFVMGLEDQMVGSNKSSVKEMFSHENIIIQPLIGKVQPRSFTDVYVIFGPTEPTVVNTTAYLDITGREERIPFYISGKGIGPKFRFGFETLDVGTVYFGGSHCYEIPVVNIGDIRGQVQSIGAVSSSSTLTLKVEPNRIKLTPNEHGAFYLSFSCTGKPADFLQELKFVVNNSEEVFYVTLKGNVAFPAVHFLLEEAQLGLVSYGFPKTHQLTLLNDSLNYVEVKLIIEDNGEDPPVDYDQILESFKTENFEFVADPAEFVLEPSRFTLRPKGMQNIMMTLYANQVREIRTKLLCQLIDIDGSIIDEIASLPVSACCTVPNLISETPEVYLTDCYTHYPYQVELKVRNNTELSTCYCLVPQKSPKIKIQSENLVGVSGPREVTTILVTLICNTVGKGILAHLDFYAVAKDEKLFTFNLKMDTISSRLELSPDPVDFGDASVMVPTPASVDIINKSPLTVHYVALIQNGGKKGDQWEIDNEIGTIEPNGTATIVVTATLVECGTHRVVLRVEMQETMNFVDAKMTILGTGTSLEFNPELQFEDEIDFGTVFVKMEKSIEYEIKNVGFLSKVLEFRHVKDGPPEYPPKTKSRLAQPSRSGIDNTPLPDDLHTKRTIFTLNPLKRLLQPNATMSVNFLVASHMSKHVEEHFVLWTYTPKPPDKAPMIKIVKKKKTEDIYKPTISRHLILKARIEAVNLQFSTTDILLRIDASPVQDSFEQRETLKIENTGQLPVGVHFKTSFPFSIVLHQYEVPVEEWTYEISAEETVRLTINFDGRHLRKDRGSVFFDSVLVATNIDLPGTETVKLRGEVHFPTLNFTKNKIDFGSIKNGTEAVEVLEVSNQGVFCLAYKWYIKPGSTIIEFQREEEEEDEEEEDDGEEFYKNLSFGEDEEEEEDEEEGDEEEELKSKTNEEGEKPERQKTLNIKEGEELVEADEDVDENLEANEEFDDMNAKGEEDLVAPKLGSNSTAFSCLPDLSYSDDSMDVAHTVDAGVEPGGIESMVSFADLDEVGQFSLEQSFRSKMLDMVGLADNKEEPEDEFNYLSFNRNVLKYTGPISTNEVLDIIPLSGIISAGTSLTFTIVFYGHSNIKFKTTAICYIEGGTSKTVTIEGFCRQDRLLIPKSFCVSRAVKMTDRADGEEVVQEPEEASNTLE